AVAAAEGGEIEAGARAAGDERGRIVAVDRIEREEAAELRVVAAVERAARVDGERDRRAVVLEHREVDRGGQAEVVDPARRGARAAVLARAGEDAQLVAGEIDADEIEAGVRGRDRGIAI